MNINYIINNKFAMVFIKFTIRLIPKITLSTFKSYIYYNLLLLFYLLHLLFKYDLFITLINVFNLVYDQTLVVKISMLDCRNFCYHTNLFIVIQWKILVV